MAQKFHVQHLLFNTTSNATVINKLIHIIIKLEVLAHILQTAEYNQVATYVIYNYSYYTCIQNYFTLV